MLTETMLTIIVIGFAVAAVRTLGPGYYKTIHQKYRDQRTRYSLLVEFEDTKTLVQTGRKGLTLWKKTPGVTVKVLAISDVKPS